MSDDDLTDEEALKAAAGVGGAGGEEDDMEEEDEDKDPPVEASDDDDDDENGDDSSDSTEGSKTDPPEMKKKMEELAKKKAQAEAAKARKAKAAAERNASNSSKGGKKTKATDQGKQPAKRKKTGGRTAGKPNKATVEQEKALRKKTAEQTAAAGRKENAIKPGTKRSGNFSEEEDKILCRAWVSITTSSIVGANQTAKQFWKSVEIAYNTFARDNSPEDPNVHSRNDESLKSRFQKTIQAQMNKFMRYYRQELALKKSGVSEDDIIEAAMEKFAEMERGAFKLKHCVEILAAVPKFDATYTAKQVEELEASDAKANDVDGNMMGSNSVRPQGSKSAKSALEIQRHRERTDKKRTAIQSRMADANFKIAVAMERKRKVDSEMQVAQMYLQLGNTEAANAQLAKVMALNKAAEEEDEMEKLTSRRSSLGSTIATRASMEDEEDEGDDDIVMVGGVSAAASAARIIEQTGLPKETTREEVSQRNETNDDNAVNSNDGFPSPPPLGIVPI